MGWRETWHSLWQPVDALAATVSQAEPPLPPDQWLSQLHLKLSQAQGMLLTGNIHTLFAGAGLELKTLREYQPGDDLRKMDWNVLARTGVPHVKEHEVERRIPVWFVVDATRPMTFGQVQSKLAYAKTLVGLLGLLALETDNTVGLVLWQGDTAPTVIGPKPGQIQLQWILERLDRAIDARLPEAMAFPDLNRVFSNRSLVFMLSDFAFLSPLTGVDGLLGRLAGRHSVRSFLLVDPVERDGFSGKGQLPVTDFTGKVYWVDTADTVQKVRYRDWFQEVIAERLRQLALWSQSDVIMTSTPPHEVLAQFAGTPKRRRA